MKEVPKKDQSSVAGGVVETPSLPPPGIYIPQPVTGTPAVPPVGSFPDYLTYQPK